MLRLAHRIIVDGVEMSDDVRNCSSGERQMWGGFAERFRESVAASTVVIADEVMDYFVQTATYGEISTDFNKHAPCLAPPAERVFVEHKPNPLALAGVVESMPYGMRFCDQGVLFDWADADNADGLAERYRLPPGATERPSAECRWFCLISFVQHFQWQGRSVVGFGGTTVLLWVGPRGESVSFNLICTSPTTISNFAKDEMLLDVIGTVYPAMLAVAFMNCKNVVRRDVTETEGPSPKWLRRQKAPEIRYHVLDINPMKEVLRTEGGIESNGLKKALHICRGHFVTYTEERPLFGKITGTFWKPSHVRGSVENGIVDKDYRLKLN